MWHAGGEAGLPDGDGYPPSRPVRFQYHADKLSTSSGVVTPIDSRGRGGDKALN